MATLAMQINSVVENLHEPDQALVLEIVKRFLPDDVATEDDLAAIAIARDEYRRGETISEEDIDWS